MVDESDKSMRNDRERVTSVDNIKASTFKENKNKNKKY